MEADWTNMMMDKVIRHLDPDGASQKETIPVAVIISGRNYGQFLGDCIESVKRQTPAPAEIVYMDNASEDDSIAIARAKGLPVCVISTQARNICALRNRGLLRTTQPFVMFLDADDVIPKGYVKTLYDGMSDRRVGIVYPKHVSFGLYRSPGWGADAPGIYEENSIAGQSLVRRRAVEQVGGWGNMPVFQDWELWLRVIEQGWVIKQAPIDYEHRTHASSKTASFNNRMPWYQEVLRRRPVTVFTPFGPGRPITGKRYFEMLENLGLNWDVTTLFFYDNSRSAKTADMLKGYLKDCPARSTIYHRDDVLVGYSNLIDRVEVMPERMAEMWTEATKRFSTPFVMSIEDDNEPYKPNGYSRLFEGMAPDVGAVCGMYYSRPIVDHNRLLALEWYHRNDGATSLREIGRYPGDLPHPPSDGCTDIGATGVGFVLLRTELLKNFDYPVGTANSWCGQDFGLWRHVRDRGKRLMCHWGVKTKHYHTPTDYV